MAEIRGGYIYGPYFGEDDDVLEIAQVMLGGDARRGYRPGFLEAQMIAEKLILLDIARSLRKIASSTEEISDAPTLNSYRRNEYAEKHTPNPANKNRITPR